MMGKSHIICTTGILFTMCSIHVSCINMVNGTSDTFYGLNPERLRFVQNIDASIWSFLGFNTSFQFSYFLLLFFIFTLLGTLLTDCDSKTSIIGRFLYIPVEHRTWLHAIWIPLFCFPASLAENSRLQPIVWIGFGWILHEFMDSFSYEGNAFLYPFVGYHDYGQAKVKKGIHNFKLYHTGKRSETIFVFIVVLICILFSSFFLLSSRFQIDIVGEGVGLWA